MMLKNRELFGNTRRYCLTRLFCFFLDITFGHDRFRVEGAEVLVTKSQSDLRSIALEWTPSNGPSIPPTQDVASGPGVVFIVKYCEDNPWDDTPRSCKSFSTNETRAQLKDLRPSTKYLVNVEEASARAGRMLTPDSPSSNNNQRTVPWKDGDNFLDRSKSLVIETQKYAVRKVDCKKGETDVTIETGEDFEGVISVQQPDGRPDNRCLVRGYGTPQRSYVLAINHSQCAMELLENGTIMNTVILIQEHATLVLGSDRSLRISCNYQPAVIRLETGMGKGSRVIQIGPDDDTRADKPPSQLRPAIFSSKYLPPAVTFTSTAAPPGTLPRRTKRLPVEASRSMSRSPSMTSLRPSWPPGAFREEDFYGKVTGPVTSPVGPVTSPVGPVTSPVSPIGRRIGGDGAVRNSNGNGVLSPTSTQPSLPDFFGIDTLMAANFSHQETAIINENVKPRPSGMSLLQVIAITATCSLAAILLVCFAIWLIVFREICSRHTTSKRSKRSGDELRFG